VVASFVKGSVAFGFPLVATPLLALALGVKSAVAVSILPNIVMDVVQVARRGGVRGSLRRVAGLLLFGFAGVVLGTRLLAILSPRAALGVLGVVVLVFVLLSFLGLAPRVPARWERWLSPPVGLLAGLLGGLTNVPGTPLVIYFHALGMDKGEFVRTVALCFLTYKVVQLGATAWYGLLTGTLLLASVALTLVGLGGFALGLSVQDRMPERTFDRAVLALLGGLGVWLAVEGLG
jgi:uncharacterized membrane protein YfcA